MSASSSRKRISTREYPLCSKLPREMSGDRDSASSSTNSADSDAVRKTPVPQSTSAFALQEHPRRLIPELYTYSHLIDPFGSFEFVTRHFYNLGWTTGSGGSVSIKDSDGYDVREHLIVYSALFSLKRYLCCAFWCAERENQGETDVNLETCATFYCSLMTCLSLT